MEAIICPGCKGILAQITRMPTYDSYELTTREIRRMKEGGIVYLFCQICRREVHAESNISSIKKEATLKGWKDY